MKLLMPSIIDEVIASSSNSNYPISSVLSEYPKDIWKSADIGIVTVQISLSSWDNCAVIIDSNVPGNNGVSWSVKNSVGTELETGTELNKTTRTAGSAYWIEFTNNANQDHIVFTFNNPEIHQLGCIQAGKFFTFADPKTGLNKSYEDYSIIKKLNSGSEYSRQRDRVDIYSGNLQDIELDAISGDSDFVEITKGLSPDPLSCQVLHKGYVKTLYAKIESSVSIEDNFRGNISFTVREVV